MKYNLFGMNCAACDAHGSANAGGWHGCQLARQELRGR